MVNQGVITQEQADAIKAVQPERAFHQWEGERKGVPVLEDGYSDDLVQQGVIDQATADKIKEYLTLEAEAKKAEAEKIKAMSEEERQAYREELKQLTPPASPFEEMVNQGVITQEQADAIKAVQPEKGFHQRGGEEFKRP
jgi:membrane peptidoglycan carboxypeptidase